MKGHSMTDQEDEGLHRRDVLAVGAVAAGAVLLTDPRQAPGAQVEDRGSSIRITGIRGLPCGPKAYVKVETNNKNITGWGEITGLEPRVAASLAEAFREL